VKKSQLQLCRSAMYAMHQFNIELDWARKAMAQHHVDDGKTLDEAWEIEKDVNSRIARKKSIIFPSKRDLKNYMNWYIENRKGSNG